METNQALTPAEHLWTKDYILITVVSLFTFLGFQMLFPTLPVYAKSLGGNDAHAGLVIGFFTFSAVIIRPFVGYALDVFGRKGILFIGLLIFTGAVLAYLWTPSIIFLLLVRFIHGFGWGLTSTATSTVATDVIPPSRMGEGMGYFGLAATLSMALAPALGLYIISHYNFKFLFILSTFMASIAIILSFKIKYNTVVLPRQKFNLIEKEALRPSIVIFFMTMTYGAVVTFLALYSIEQGISNIGIFFTVYAIFLALTRPIAGRLADKSNFDIVVIPGIICIIVAMLFLSNANSLLWFILAAIAYGIGFGSVHPSLQALAIIRTPPERRGGANATFFTGFDLGIGLSSIMWGFVAQAVGYSMMYLYAMIPAGLGLIFYYFYKP